MCDRVVLSLWTPRDTGPVLKTGLFQHPNVSQEAFIVKGGLAEGCHRGPARNGRTRSGFAQFKRPAAAGPPVPSHSHTAMASITCRVQYLEDSDPFICTNFPEPRRPPTVNLEENLPLSEQLAGIHKLLEAPLKVGHEPNSRYQNLTSCLTET